MSKQIILDKEELESVFYDFGVIENQLANFLLIVDALQLHYEDDMLNEKFAIMCLFKCQLFVMHQDMKRTLGKSDELFFDKENVCVACAKIDTGAVGKNPNGR